MQLKMTSVLTETLNSTAALADHAVAMATQDTDLNTTAATATLKDDTAAGQADLTDQQPLDLTGHNQTADKSVGEQSVQRQLFADQSIMQGESIKTYVLKTQQNFTPTQSQVFYTRNYLFF